MRASISVILRKCGSCVLWWLDLLGRYPPLTHDCGLVPGLDEPPLPRERCV